MALELDNQRLEVTIHTADADRSLAFYRDVLGFDLVQTLTVAPGAKIHRLTLDGIEVKLLVTGAAATPSAPDPTAQYGLRYLTFNVRNLEQIVQDCRRAGAVLQFEPREIAPGISIAMVEDPDHVVLEFKQTRKRKDETHE